MYDIVHVDKKTKYIENFLTQKECESLINYLEYMNSSGLSPWNQISFYGSYAIGFYDADYDLPKFGLEPEYMNNLRNKFQKIGEEVFQTKLKLITFHSQKWKDGAFANWHSDNSDEDGNPTAFERSRHAIFVYLNDNYEGGHIKFKSGFEMKPKTGTLALFEGDHTNMHAVTRVVGPDRYTIGSFWDYAENVYPKEKYDFWASDLAEAKIYQKNEFDEWNSLKEKGILLEPPSDLKK